MSKTLFYRLALSMIPQVGPVKFKQLIANFGSAEAVFEADSKALKPLTFLSEDNRDKILQKAKHHAAEKEVKFIEDNSIQVLYHDEVAFPERVKTFENAPAILFHKGSVNLNHHRTIGIVGTRKTTPYGQEVCKQIVEELQGYDVQVISGLANGIDSIAHRKSLDLDIPTIGVLGHGLQMIYPYNNKSLALEMEKTGGILTEYTSDQGPDREHFPARNKIVAAMCDALLVIESAEKGGSLITARFAHNYCKKVFALPGRKNDSMSAGCNMLIKNKQADLAESAADIARVMKWSTQSKLAHIQTKLFIELDDREKEILGVIKKLDTPTLDRICYETKILNSEMASLLLNLEFKGVIKSLPGKRYIQTA